MTPLLCGPLPKNCLMASELCSRLRCVTITPLGACVLPEVYCKKARLSPVSSGLRQADSMPGSRLSVAIHCNESNSGTPAKRFVTSVKIFFVVSTKLGFASATIESSREVNRFIRGMYAGTAMTPAYKQPKNAVMYSKPGG